MMPDEFRRDQLKQRMQELNVLSKLRDVVYRWAKAELIEVHPDGTIRKVVKKEGEYKEAG